MTYRVCDDSENYKLLCLVAHFDFSYLKQTQITFMRYKIKMSSSFRVFWGIYVGDSLTYLFQDLTSH